MKMINRSEALPSFAWEERISDNDYGYTDLNPASEEYELMSAALDSFLHDTDISIMPLYSASKQRIALVFSNITNDHESFEKELTKALRKSGLKFETCWCEDWQNTVFCISL